MKHILLVVVCFASICAYSQTTEQIVVQEKSSDWIRVAVATVAPPSAPAKASTHKAVRKKRPAIKPQESDFEKTNQQVNRFKKTKDD